jgi:hypothetical protein
LRKSGAGQIFFDNMKTLILYGSERKLTGNYVEVFGGPRGGKYFVRAERSFLSIPEALNAAKPRPGEIVLNTVEVK